MPNFAWLSFTGHLLDNTFTHEIDSFTDYDRDRQNKFESIFTIYGLVASLVYNRGFQPRVREKPQGVRLIQVLCTIEQYLLVLNSQGVHKFLFLCLGVREHKKVGNRWFVRF